MNTDIFHSRFMRDYIGSLHQVLIKNEIITNPKVIKCGQYLSREKGYIRYRIQCDKVKLCPRCKYRSAPERIQKMISEQKKCLENHKNLFMVTLPIKHGKSDSLDSQVKTLRKFIAKLKNSTNTNLLILDEIFDSSLDTSGTDEFMRILYHTMSKENVFVISHKGDTLIDKFPRVMKFEKYKNFTRMAE